MNVEEQWQRINEVHEAIQFDGSISLLTGRNQSGKSLIRSQLTFSVKQADGRMVYTSMDLRTGSNLGLGAFSRFAADDPWLATGFQTLHNLKQVVNIAEKDKDTFLAIDEPELGLGLETQLAVAHWLNEKLPKLDIMGILVVTHSPIVAKNLIHHNFYNLDGYETLEDWLNRPITPTDLAELEANELFHFIQERQKDK